MFSLKNGLKRKGFRDIINPRKEDKAIRVANGVEVDKEAVGQLPLELNSGFTLSLRNVFYIPSMKRNLILVSVLDDDGFDCHFCVMANQIMFNDKYVGLAF